MNTYSICGINCTKCEYKEKCGCKGCRESKGIMFWGECKLAKCAIEKKLDHCGLCSNFPCDDLKAFAYDEGEGDNGERIENLRKLIAN
ncbi:DUF3795 domain-containing protein [Vallitalea okinawensis]|uniref:DUF3795 domain-containing protein n=1 Tax=Vallitalea okinawensis TaxID=2078660 RepID=UPI000CFAEE1E|nr:DUF3795 domain-containing protein [Vallitalea okinawensis]